MNEREIRRLIKILEETNIDEIEIRKWWGGRLRVARRTGVVSQIPLGAPGTPAVEVSTIQSSPSQAAGGAPETTESAAAAAEEYSEKTHHIIHSPIIGTFYRAPAPDAPPYVEMGDIIKAGQVVCIIEAMKLMNEIQAENGGKVVKILVDNAMPVEYNQMMIVLEPEA